MTPAEASNFWKNFGPVGFVLIGAVALVLGVWFAAYMSERQRTDEWLNAHCRMTSTYEGLELRSRLLTCDSLPPLGHMKEQP